MTSAQSHYTSSTAKLLHHLDCLQLIQKKGIARPIMLELAPTNHCDLECCFCSVANRDRSEELSLFQILEAVDLFKSLGLQSVELTGGGDPLCHPEITAVIDALFKRGLKIGLITNGIRLSTLSRKDIGKLEWVRVSLNTLDYRKEVKIPEGISTLGFSYVWNIRSTVERLHQISDYAEKYDAQYVRVVPDCLSSVRIDKARKEIAPLMDRFPRFFFTMKGYDKPCECWLGYLRPFLNADGYVYRCSAHPLIERKFAPRFRICHYSEILEYWGKTLKPFATDKCGLCFFKEQNELLSLVINPVEHTNFV